VDTLLALCQKGSNREVAKSGTPYLLICAIKNFVDNVPLQVRHTANPAIPVQLTASLSVYLYLLICAIKNFVDNVPLQVRHTANPAIPVQPTASLSVYLTVPPRLRHQEPA
jgi:hypothetical protein